MTHSFPNRIFSGKYASSSHVQGIAVDTEAGYVYYSFTTMLLKTDLSGNPVGSVHRLAGHLGCITFDAKRRRVCGSLELKHDAIGKGIIAKSGWDPSAEDSFYLVSFDVDRIDRMGMDAERDGVMRAVYLRDVVSDYHATDEVSNCPHRYGCSGIDGTGLGPAFGMSADAPEKLMVAYGIYGDVDRTDNDYQVILQYDPSVIDQYGKPLDQSAPHHSGPERCERRYFLYTGNTTYGVQNLEYDAHTKCWIASVYRGKKPCFENHSTFFIDGKASPQSQVLQGRGGEVGEVLMHASLPSKRGSVGSVDFAYGQTGIFSFGDGSYYFSHDGRDREAGVFYTEFVKYRMDPLSEDVFVRVE